MSASRPWDVYQFQFFYVPDRAECQPALTAYKSLDTQVQANIACVNLRKYAKSMWPKILGVPCVVETFGSGKASRVTKTIVKMYSGLAEVMEWFKNADKKTYTNVVSGRGARVASTMGEQQFFSDHTTDIEDMSDDAMMAAMMSKDKISADAAKALLGSMVLDKPPPPPTDADVLATEAEVEFILTELERGPDESAKPPRLTDDDLGPSYSAGQIDNMVKALANET